MPFTQAFTAVPLLSLCWLSIPYISSINNFNYKPLPFVPICTHIAPTQQAISNTNSSLSAKPQRFDISPLSPDHKMPRNSKDQPYHRHSNMFSWLHPHHHGRENTRSASQDDTHHRNHGNSRSNSPRDAATSSAPRDGCPPPSYESAVNAVPTSAAEIPTTAAPADTPPPAWNEELPPPSYEDATEDDPRQLRLGNGSVLMSNAPTVATNFMNARRSNPSGNLHPGRGISLTSTTGNGSTYSVTFGGIQVGSISGAGVSGANFAVGNVTINGPNHGGIQVVGGLSGAEITIAGGGVSIHSPRADANGNTVVHNFFSARGGNLTIGGRGGGSGTRNLTVSNSSRRARSPSQRRSGWSSDGWSEGESSDEEDSDGDERWYGQEGNRGRW